MSQLQVEDVERTSKNIVCLLSVKCLRFSHRESHSKIEHNILSIFIAPFVIKSTNNDRKHSIHLVP